MTSFRFHIIIKTIAFTFLFLCLPLWGCSPDPGKQIIESLSSLETVMHRNVESPQTLLIELDKYIESNTAVWQQIDKTFENYSTEKAERIIYMNEDQMRSIMLNIMNLDLEIQDRLSNDPEMLSQYMERIRKIGIY